MASSHRFVRACILMSVVAGALCLTAGLDALQQDVAQDDVRSSDPKLEVIPALVLQVPSRRLTFPVLLRHPSRFEQITLLKQ